MKKFAECFSDYLNRYHLSFKRAALLCGMDRTLLRRYAKGDRMPKKEETVREIAAGLSMDREEEENLCMAYRRSRMGERQYQMNCVLEKIKLCRQAPEAPWGQKNCFAGEEKEMPAPESVRRLKGPLEIMEYLKKVLFQAEYLRLSMNPSYPEILTLLTMVLEQNPRCQAEHIMGMSSFYDEDNMEDIVNFKSVLPLLAAAENYQIFHHYRWGGMGEAEKSELNICLTDRGLVLFDLEMKHGLFSNQGLYLQYFLEHFRQRRQHCFLFAETVLAEPAGTRGKTEEISAENGSIMIATRSSGRESVLIRKDFMKEKEIYLEEEGMVHLIKNYLIS